MPSILLGVFAVLSVRALALGGSVWPLLIVLLLWGLIGFSVLAYRVVIDATEIRKRSLLGERALLFSECDHAKVRTFDAPKGREVLLPPLRLELVDRTGTVRMVINLKLLSRKDIANMLDLLAERVALRGRQGRF